MPQKIPSFPKTFLAFLLPLLAGVALYIAAQPKLFMSITRLEIAKIAPTDGSSNYDPFFLQTQIELLQSDAVLAATLTRLKLIDKYTEQGGGTDQKGSISVATRQLRRHVSISQYRSTSLLELKVFSKNAAEAVAIANQIPLAARLQKGAAQIEVIEEAKTAIRPISHRIPLIATLGILLSIALVTHRRRALRLKPASVSN